MTDWLDKVIGVGLAGVVALIAWIVRNVFTNQKQLGLLELSLKEQEKEMAKLTVAIDKITDTNSMIQPVLVEQTKLLREILSDSKKL